MHGHSIQYKISEIGRGSEFKESNDLIQVFALRLVGSVAAHRWKYFVGNKELPKFSFKLINKIHLLIKNV